MDILFLHRHIAFQQLLNTAHQVVGNLFKRVIAHADADRAGGRHIELGSIGQTCIGAAGTGRADDAVKVNVHLLCLLGNLMGTVDISQRAQRNRTTHRNEVRCVTLLFLLLHHAVHLCINIIIGIGVHKADLCTENAVEDLVASGKLAALFEDQHRPHSQTGSTGCGQHGVVGLRAACGKDDVHSLFFGICQQKFQLSDLVAAQCHTNHIIPFDVDVLACFSAQVFQLVQWSGKNTQLHTGKF